MRYVAIVALLAAAAAGTASAQETSEVAAKYAAEAALQAKIQNVRVSVESKVTKDAPYSAEAVTESVQSLADGNRIVTRNTTRIFRDSDGRVRREQLNAAGTEVVSINISDPVAGTSYILEPATHIAYRNGLFITAADPGAATFGAVGQGWSIATRSPEGGVIVARPTKDPAVLADELKTKIADEMKVADEIKVRSAAGGAVIAYGASVTSSDMKKTTQEDLGQQTIEGVIANGTRSITEIAAGAIGNEQPIKILSEQWFSSDLQVLVLTKHVDPRAGETIYRLNGIVRAEPAHSLFELPPDYTLKESQIKREFR
jgi:hypothetical protein